MHKPKTHLEGPPIPIEPIRVADLPSGAVLSVRGGDPPVFLFEGRRIEGIEEATVTLAGTHRGRIKLRHNGRTRTLEGAALVGEIEAEAVRVDGP